MNRLIACWLFSLISVLQASAYADTDLVAGRSGVEQVTSDRYSPHDQILVDTPTSYDSSIPQHPVVGTKRVLVTVTHWQGEQVLKKSVLETMTLSSDPYSLRSYVLSSSGDKLTLIGQIVESTSGPRPADCNYGAVYPLSLAISEGQKTAKAHGLDPAAFDYEIHIINCGGAASAYVPGRVMGVYGMPNSAHVFMHEFGHNLGYNHGATYRNCSKNSNTLRAPDGCTYVALGDTGDTVSGGSAPYPAVNRFFSGWLDDKQVAVISQNGLYALGQLGTKGVPQLYLIKVPGYFSLLSLEFRKPTIFDGFAPDDNRVNGVWMRYSAAKGSLANIQIDANPLTTVHADPAFGLEQRLEESSGKVKVRVCSAGPNIAILSVVLNGGEFPYCSTTVPAPIIDVPAQNALTGYRPVFAGTGWPGAYIVISTVGDPAVIVGQGFVGANGRWSIQISATHSKGKYSYTARQYFGPRNSVLATARNFEVADLPVTPPTIDAPARNALTGSRPTLSGTGIPGAAIGINEQNQPVLLASGIVDGYGRWSAPVNWSLAAKTVHLTGRQSIDGKQSGWMPDYAFQVVSWPPQATILAPAKNATTGRTPLITGSGVVGANVLLFQQYQPGILLGSAIVGGNGIWSIQITSPLPLGYFRLTGYQLIDGKRSDWIVDHPIVVSGSK